MNVYGDTSEVYAEWEAAEEDDDEPPELLVCEEAILKVRTSLEAAEAGDHSLWIHNDGDERARVTLHFIGWNAEDLTDDNDRSR